MEENHENQSVEMTTFTSDSTTTTTTTQPSKTSARAKAEARRKRILEKSKQRMMAVGGGGNEDFSTTTKSKSPSLNHLDNSTTSSSQDVVAVDESESVTPPATSTNSDGAGAGAGADDIKASSMKSSSGNARLAQMRRRRFKKANAGGTSTTSTTTATTASSSSVETSMESTSLSNAHPSSVSPVPAPVQPPSITTTSKTNELPPESTTKEEEASSEKTIMDATQTEIQAPKKKKYLGVAKMRRKMLVEKKKQEPIHTESITTPTTTTSTSATSSNSSSSQSNPKMDLTAQWTHRQIRIVLIMKFITIICLFLSGVWVGYQNRVTISKNGNKMETKAVYIRKDLALYESHLLQLIRPSAGNKKYNSRLHLSAKKSSNLIMSEKEEEWKNLDSVNEIQDEFSTIISTTNDNHHHQRHLDPNQNIDFFFRVNLDIYTQGDGLLFIMARKAVQFHRFWTGLFLGFITNYYPPILCILAFLTRRMHIWSCRYLFGISHSYSDLLKMEESSGKDQQGLDIVDTITNAVKSTLSGVVPEVVWVCWEYWWNLRTDMYIVLCGLLMGLTIPMSLGGQGSSGGESGIEGLDQGEL